MSDPPALLPLLPLLRRELELCVYCPKLCRATCPVANAEASETLTPWGKMSMAYFAARGDVPNDRDHAAVAWGCSACYACRERCEHDNPVATVLGEARAAAFARSVAPEITAKVAAGAAGREADIDCAIAALQRVVPARARVAALIGCTYLRHFPEIAAAALTVIEWVVGEPVRVARGCCGLPLYYAGDRPSFTAAARQMAATLAPFQRVVVVDPGCTVALTQHYARLGIEVPEVVPLVDLLYRNIARLPALALAELDVLYHDPCQLGRGLGRYDEPRAILARLTGKAPRELLRTRADAECSGGGGLLPLTYPAASAAAADELIAALGEAGGGPLVTACAGSLRRLRSRGEPAEDLVSLVARALERVGA